LFKWRISIFGKTPAVRLGSVTAPDEEIARQQAIELYSIPPSQKFRVMAVRIEEPKRPRRAQRL